jgi:energy-converting hydrogenase Eha subunit G
MCQYATREELISHIVYKLEEWDLLEYTDLNIEVSRELARKCIAECLVDYYIVEGNML